jgi:hypothetical protein
VRGGRTRRLPIVGEREEIARGHHAEAADSGTPEGRSNLPHVLWPRQDTACGSGGPGGGRRQGMAPAPHQPPPAHKVDDALVLRTWGRRPRHAAEVGPIRPAVRVHVGPLVHLPRPLPLPPCLTQLPRLNSAPQRKVRKHGHLVPSPKSRQRCDLPCVIW